jgi:flavin-dependent dehydrogenase
MEYDAIVIGGGPAGSTSAGLLAQQGVKTLLVERDTFPRFHVGESLLPTSMNIFKRLGVLEHVEKRYTRKPGGKWLYGSHPICAQFEKCSNASFSKAPYAFQVERSSFDEMLLRTSADKGADVWEGRRVVGFLYEGNCIAGVKVKNSAGDETSIRSKITVDCSGQRALISNELGLRTPNILRRMAVHGHYETELLDPDVENGWFSGQLIDDGWVWLIPLEKNKLSIGAVVDPTRFSKSGLPPQEFLEQLMASTPYLRDVIPKNRKLIGEVHTTGTMGFTSRSLAGDGWILAGDAAFFIDPCYSSGVYLAMRSGEMAADSVCRALSNGGPHASAFTEYQHSLKTHEASVLAMVDLFYSINNSRIAKSILPWIPPALYISIFTRFAGGDYDVYRGPLKMVVEASRRIAKFLP